MKDAVESMCLENTIQNFKGFEESKEYEYFETVYAMIDKPAYTLMQCKENKKMNTSSENWFLCLPKDGQLVIIDAGTEDDICDQFFNLIELMKYGFGTAEIRPKDTKTAL